MLDPQEELLKSIFRIKATSDGQDFINFLLTLSKNNYKAFKCSPHEFNDIHKGQAIAIDELIDLFETCEDKINRIQAAAEMEDEQPQEGWV